MGKRGVRMRLVDDEDDGDDDRRSNPFPGNAQMIDSHHWNPAGGTASPATATGMVRMVTGMAVRGEQRLSDQSAS
jgi:hypothetical protein